MALHPLVKLMIKAAVPVPQSPAFVESIQKFAPLIKTLRHQIYSGWNIQPTRQQLQQAFQEHLPLMWQRMAQARTWHLNRAARLAAQQAALVPGSPQAIAANAVQALNQLDKIYGPSTREILTMARQRPFVTAAERQLFRTKHPKPIINALAEMINNARQQVQAGGYKNFEEFAQSPKFREFMASLKG
jgi:hypothetical protein